ncbi:Protein ycf2, partial [Ophiophagus hannah]
MAFSLDRLARSRVPQLLVCGTAPIRGMPELVKPHLRDAGSSLSPWNLSLVPKRLGATGLDDLNMQGVCPAHNAAAPCFLPQQLVTPYRFFNVAWFSSPELVCNPSLIFFSPSLFDPDLCLFWPLGLGSYCLAEGCLSSTNCLIGISSRSEVVFSRILHPPSQAHQATPTKSVEEKEEEVEGEEKTGGRDREREGGRRRTGEGEEDLEGEEGEEEEKGEGEGEEEEEEEDRRGEGGGGSAQNVRMGVHLQNVIGMHCPCMHPTPCMRSRAELGGLYVPPLAHVPHVRHYASSPL